ncbi:tetratricopeptide repeat protein 24 isoform X3 [Oreochromis niloticus]|uniref:tetratricopeptide repeat protein 24 isoform X3 n=1 Tax=Oreochromis niloticus TaxID=8128 RepID=UPI0009049551|nr:tetratricopeptide repeat protein 24 isoform X3 [Oreochromis niloticus]
MTSHTAPSGKEAVKVKRRSGSVGRKQTADIEEFTFSGHKALQEGRPQEALGCFRDALKAADQLQDSRVLRACSFNLGAAYVEVGRPRKGLDFLQRAQPGPKADRLPDLQFNLALAHDALGQSRKAATYFLQAAQLYRSQGDGRSEGDACVEMSRCYGRTRDWTLAAQGYLRAAESYRVANMLDYAATALSEAGSHMFQSDQCNQDDIIGVLSECLSLMGSITDPRTLGELYLSVGVSYCRLRSFQEAVQCFQKALSPTAKWPPLLAKVLNNLGAALNSMGQFRSAVDYHRLAAGLYGSQGCRGNQARCFSNLAFAFSRIGEEEEAAESFILALQGFRDTGDYLAQAQVCEALAECYLVQRKQHKAVQLYKQALSALSHCQDSSGIQDQLVERLTATLQQSLTVGPQKPHPPAPHSVRPHRHSLPIGPHVRKSDITNSPGTAANQQPDAPEPDAPGSQQEASETPEYMSTVPGQSSDQLDKRQHTIYIWSCASPSGTSEHLREQTAAESESLLLIGSERAGRPMQAGVLCVLCFECDRKWS